MKSIVTWPIHKIMQLPDECFGRRWWISTVVSSEADGAGYNVAEEQFPDRCVIWGLMFNIIQTDATHCQLGIRLAHEQQISAARWNTYEKLFLEWMNPDWQYDLFMPVPTNYWMGNLRYPIVGRPRHVCTRVACSGGSGYSYGNLALLISGFPTDVPSWLNLDPDEKPY